MLNNALLIKFSFLLRHLFLLTGVLFSSVFAQTVNQGQDPYPFVTLKQEQQFQELSQEFRCLVCQNQSLADSNADLAKDLRQRLYELVLQNNTNDQIRDYFVERYGDFVLYAPPVKAATLVLWSLPVVLLLIGLGVGGRLIYRHKRIQNISTISRVTKL